MIVAKAPATSMHSLKAAIFFLVFLLVGLYYYAVEAQPLFDLNLTLTSEYDPVLPIESVRVVRGSNPQDLLIYLSAPSAAWVHQERVNGHYLIDIPYAVITRSTLVEVPAELPYRLSWGNQDEHTGRLLITPAPPHVEVVLQHGWAADPNWLDPWENSQPLPLPLEEVLEPLLEVPPRSAFLTIDDGPWPQSTPRLLEVLDQLQIPATFFLIGNHVSQFPELAQSIRAHHHTIANHTFTHDYRRLYSSDAIFYAEVDQTTQLLKTLHLDPQLVVRPPGGFRLDSALRRSLEQAGYRVLYWNMSPEDAYAGQTAAQLLERVQAQLQVFKNSDQPLVLLLHDRWPHTAEALPNIVAAIEEAGYRFLPWPAFRDPA
ncbi:polysaccharide deacetylase family protein [Synechococcus sp. H55.5]